MLNNNPRPSAKLWVEYKPGAWKLLEDLKSFRTSNPMLEAHTMEVAYDDVKRLLSHLASVVKSPTSQVVALVPVPSPAPAAGKFGDNG
jgi:hypothetical protein